MIVDQPVVLDKDKVSNMTPDQVSFYLMSTGWQPEVVQRQYGLWWTRPDGEEPPHHLREFASQRSRRWGGDQSKYFTQCLSLDLATLGDYVSRMVELVISLAVYEDRHAAAVLEDIYSIDASAATGTHSAIVVRLRDRGLTVR